MGPTIVEQGYIDELIKRSTEKAVNYEDKDLCDVAAEELQNWHDLLNMARDALRICESYVERPQKQREEVKNAIFITLSYIESFLGDKENE